VKTQTPSKSIAPFDILVIGRSCLDHIVVIDHLPGEDSKIPLLMRVREGGGQGSTAACCLARLGAKVLYWGKVGNDAEGAFCLRRLLEFQVDISHVEVVEGGKTPEAFIFVTRDTRTRTIIYETSSLPPFSASYLPTLLAQPPKVILLDPETTYLMTQIKRYLKGQTSIVYDAERWNPHIEEVMAEADYFIPSHDFLLSGELKMEGLTLPERIRLLSPRVGGHLIVTCGKEGAYYVEKGELFHVPAPDVEVKDTTGAGDNFHAAFCFALTRHFPLPDAVRFSVSVASLSCREYGGRAGLPTLLETFSLMERVKVKKCPL